MSARRLLLGAITASVLLTGTAGCLGTDEADALRAEVATLTQEVESLRATLDDVEDRHDRTASATERLRTILDDPSEFGTEGEVADQLAQMATEDAQMNDDVFGPHAIRGAWRSTLFGFGCEKTDARVEMLHDWVSEDGSMSVSVWVWHGTNCAGHPFELAGVSVSPHDSTGRATEMRNHYPYPDAYVLEAFTGAGTPTGTLLVP